MARTWIANDNYVQLLKAGKGEDVTPCIRCNKCHVISHDLPYRSACSVNPAFGIQATLDNLAAPVGAPQKVAVVGGGPAGIEAARIAAQRGHAVTLFEKSGKLGGQLNAAGVPDFKWPVKRFSEYMVRQAGKYNINIRLNTEATKASLEAEGFDAVVCALGAVPAVPAIDGVDGKNVITALDALLAPEKVTGKVVIIGGGEVGVETGMFLAKRGLDVTVLGRNAKVAPEANPIHYRETFDAAWQSLDSLHVVTSAPVTAVGPDSVSYTKDGQTLTVPADTVVLATGMKGLTDEALAFYSDKYDFYMVGDCAEVGTLMTAMRSAFAVANQI